MSQVGVQFFARSAPGLDIRFGQNCLHSITNSAKLERAGALKMVAPPLPLTLKCFNQLDNTEKRCGIMAVIHITDYDVLTLTHDLDNKRADGMQE